MRTSSLMFLALALLAGCGGAATPPVTGPYTGTGAITMGIAKDGKSASATTACNDSRTQFTAAQQGTVADASGRRWAVPAAAVEGDTGVNLYNDCTGAGDNPNYAAQLHTVVIDPDGVEITAYIHADNYFELYVNGSFVCRDIIAFTPFNSSVCRFKATYPLTYAVRAVDWEEHLGVGLEYDRLNVGDGGLVISLSDGAFSDETWKAETFYFAPLDDPNCVTEGANGRNSTNCAPQPFCVSNNPTASCQALHFEEPNDWMLPAFDDTRWPAATVYTEQEFGPKEAYSNYVGVFGKGKFIWSHNLKIDNLVLMRKTVQAPPR